MAIVRDDDSFRSPMVALVQYSLDGIHDLEDYRCRVEADNGLVSPLLLQIEAEVMAKTQKMIRELFSDMGD